MSTGDKECQNKILLSLLKMQIQQQISLEELLKNQNLITKALEKKSKNLRKTSKAVSWLSFIFKNLVSSIVYSTIPLLILINFDNKNRIEETINNIHIWGWIFLFILVFGMPIYELINKLKK